MGANDIESSNSILSLRFENEASLGNGLRINLIV